MKKNAIILILFLFSAQAFSQDYLKAADREEYARYVAWCKDSIDIDVRQWGKATIVNPNIKGLDFQLYKAVYGEYSGSLLKDTVWYPLWRRGLKTAAVSLTSDQVLLHRKVRIRIQRQIPTVSHYYLSREQLREQW